MTPLFVSCKDHGPTKLDDSGQPITRSCPSCENKQTEVFQCTNPVMTGERTIVDCAGCSFRPMPVLPSTKKLILKNKLSPGDVLVMTAALESLHMQHPARFVTDVRTSCDMLFEYNPWVKKVEDDEGEIIDMEYPLVHHCNQRSAHFMQGYCDFLGDKLKLKLHLSVNRPYIYLSQQEKGWMGRVHEILGEAKPYWLICSGTKSDYTTKGWGHHAYQKVVDILKDEILFVQVGEKNHTHKPLDDVLDQLGKTNPRELARLVYHANGILCGTTFLMHLAAAFEKPAVILAGGREPRMWNTYPRQTLLSKVGQLPCCHGGSCWKSRIKPLNDGEKHDQSLCSRPVVGLGEEIVPQCMSMITPEMVTAEILGYYDSGALGRQALATA